MFYFIYKQIQPYILDLISIILGVGSNNIKKIVNYKDTSEDVHFKRHQVN